MTSVHWSDDAARSAFAGAGMTTLEQLVEIARDELITTARTRKLWKLDLAGQVFYVKVQDLRRKRLGLRKWPSYLFRGTAVGREARSLALLAELGFRTPEVVAHGQRRRLGIPRYAVLVTRQYEHYIDLVTYLKRSPDRDEARRTVDSAHALVDRAHSLGIVLLGAKYRNILVPPLGADNWSELALIDQPDLRRTSSDRLRAKDLLLMEIDRERYGSNLR